VEKLAVMRYAKALFGVAIERGDVLGFKNAADAISQSFANDAQLLGIIKHPSISRDEKISAISAAFTGRVPDDFVGLFALMLKRGREDDILGVLEHFGVLYNEYSRIATAKIISSEELQESTIEQIKDMLTKKLDKTIEFEKTIDPALIYGFRVEVDGFVFDATAKNQVEKLKRQLIGSFY
jgi:F-type H+-transporting ATPase subunit delta